MKGIGLRRNAKKKALVLICVFLLAASILTGTFAAIEAAKSQGEKGLFHASMEPQVTLIDDFDPPPNWEVGQAVSKRISVINLEESSSPVFVRLRIKEHMEAVLPGDYIAHSDGTRMLFVIHTKGDKIGKYMTLEEAKAQGLETGSHTVGDVEYATVPTGDAGKGISGKPMRGEGKLAVWGGLVGTQDLPHLTEECRYPVYLWETEGVESDGDSEPIRTYIKMDMGEEVVLMSEWDGKQGAFWILDENDGYAYWGEPLLPGKQTVELLNSLTLLGLPSDNADVSYKMHTDMEAVDEKDADSFRTATNRELIDLLLGKTESAER